MDNINKTSIENYLIYLSFVDKKITTFFHRQQEYIKCKKGCGLCCKNAQFPYSQIEFAYLLEGYMALDEEIKDKVGRNIKKVSKQKSDFSGEKFLYDCPFLIDNVCCIYNYRGIICRSFGLMYNSDDGHVKVPFCAYQGYNYSMVMDKKQNKITQDMVDAFEHTEEPLGFNIGYKFLTNSAFEKGFNFDFGDKKALIDWLQSIDY